MKIKLPRLQRLPHIVDTARLHRVLAEYVLEVRPFLEAVLDVRWVELDILDSTATARVAMDMERSPLAVLVAWARDTTTGAAHASASPWTWDAGHVAVNGFPGLTGAGPWRVRLMIIGRGNRAEVRDG